MRRSKFPPLIGEEFFMQYSDIQHYILVKLCLVLFVALGLTGIYRTWKLWQILLLMGGTCAAAYFFLIQGTQLMFWGLAGDEITIAAMYEKFAHGSFFSDFAYSSLPPFYPTLWFWLWAIPGRLLDWNGVQMTKWAATATMLLYPVLFYGVQKMFWKKKMGETPKEISWFLSSIFLFLLIDWDATILKPYELISASLVILWTQFLIYTLWNDLFTKKRMLWFGITGGILFLLFYFWFFLAAIGVSLFHLFYKKVSSKQYGSLAFVGVIMIAIGAIYWLPLSLSYQTFGAENWQLGFLTHTWLATELSVSFSIDALLMLLGFVALIIYRERLHIRILLSLFAASYVWQIMGYVTIFFFASPLQETKGFYFFNRAILALALAYGVEQLWVWGSERYKHVAWQRPVLIVATLLLSTQLFFGTFVDQDNVITIWSRAKKMHPYMGALVTELGKQFPDIKDKTVLQSGLHELHAFLPVNDFIYFNMHNSHPGAQFSERLRFVKELAASKDAEMLYKQTQKNRFSTVDVFVFYTGDPKFYPMYFHVDNFPNEFKEDIVNIPRELFDSKYFDKTFENRDYVVFVPKKM